MSRSNPSRSKPQDRQIAAEVAEVYAWIESRLAQLAVQPGACRQCGRCCDFDAFDHRLYVTTAEWVYFRAALADPPPRPMPLGRCPYNEAGVCSAHAIRFAGCRIFGCWLSAEVQSHLMESSLARLKALCVEHGLPYRYADLRDALNGQWLDIGL
jgi:hypothetical protein